MKGLLLAVGLIAALFVSSLHASIFDTASYHAPKVSVKSQFLCKNNDSSKVGFSTGQYWGDTIDVCLALTKSTYNSNYSVQSCSFANQYNEISCNVSFSAKDCAYQGPEWVCKDVTKNATHANVAKATFTKSDNQSSCPPDEFPLYTFAVDNNKDEKFDQCYNPAELDNASKCADLFNSGSILTAGGNTASLVCKTFDDGSRCAFSRVEQGSTPYYQPNLEKGCFGDAEEVPDYDKDTPPSPQPEQCTPYFGGFACAADPNNYCSSTGVCVDGCGYVNDQFICFRDEECKGASCEPAPVNCETVPDAPICKDKETIPEPTFCEKNPTVESCQSGSNFCKKNPLSPSCQLGGDGTGSGGSKFVLDYDKLIQGMKDAAKTLIDPNSIPDNTAMDKSLDDENKAIKSDYDNFLNDGVFSEIRNTSQRPIFSSLETLFPTGSGTCSFNFGKFSIEICSTAEKLREILYWVFSILTLIYLRHLFYQTIRTSAGK